MFDKGKTFDIIKVNFNENITAIPEAIQGADFTGAFAGCHKPGIFYAGHRFMVKCPYSTFNQKQMLFVWENI